MNSKPIALGLAMALIALVVLRVEFHRTLGSSNIAGTNLRCQIDQSRSVGNVVGFGSTGIWFSVIDSQGRWIQTQRIYIMGDGQSQWVQWTAPKTIVTEPRETLTVIPIELILPSGRITKHDVVVGIK